MGWLEAIISSGVLGLILGPILHRRGNMDRWLRLAQTLLAQLLAQMQASKIPQTPVGQTLLVDTLTQSLLARGVPKKYAAGLASEALRLEQRIPPPRFNIVGD